MLGLPFVLVAVFASAAPDLRQWSRDFSYNYREEPRFVRDGDMASSYGFVVDRSCLKAEGEVGRLELRNRMESWLEDTFQGVRSCDAYLPNITFLHASVGVLRRARLLCTSKAADEHWKGKRPAAAYSVWRPSRAKLPKEFHALLEAESFPLFIVVPDSLRSYLDDQGPKDAARILFHEALHHTWANNRWDHNEIETVAVDDEKPCAANMLDDRVRFFEGACMFSDKRASDLRFRLKHCGRVPACVTPLTSVHGTPEPDDEEYATWLKRTFGTLWTEKPREAELKCDSLIAELDRRAKERGVLDRDAKARVELLSLQLNKQAGGIGPDLPAYYVGALPNDKRIAVSQIPELDGRIATQCPLLTARSIYRSEPQRLLKSFDPSKAPPLCPLSAASREWPLTAPFADFHNAEQRLQAASLKAADALGGFVEGKEADLDQLERDVVSAYQDGCPSDPDAFRPSLCDGGESLLLGSIREVRARLGLDR